MAEQQVTVRPGDITIAEDGSVRITNPGLAERLKTIATPEQAALLANQACNNWVAACGCQTQ